jgi:hypothetical protein
MRGCCGAQRISVMRELVPHHEKSGSFDLAVGLIVS